MEVVVASSIFNPTAPDARTISDLFVILLIVAAAIFVLVTGLLLYAAVRFRAWPRTREGRSAVGQRQAGDRLDCRPSPAAPDRFRPDRACDAACGSVVGAERSGRSGDRPPMVVGDPVPAHGGCHGQRDPSACRQEGTHRLAVRRCGPQSLATPTRGQDANDSGPGGLYVA